MSDQGPSGGDMHPASSNPVSQPASAPPAGSERAVDRTRPQSQDNPRSRGHRPAGSDWRQAQPEARASSEQQGASGDQGQGQQQQPGAEPPKVRIGDSEYLESDIRSALAHKLESDARAAALPQSPDKYDVKLPGDFKAPEGANFEFNKDDPLLARARELAHKRGLSQEEFSDFLGVYAASRIGEQQTLQTAREAQKAQLGSAADSRIAAIDTWLHARVGQKADLIVSQLKVYPVASMVEAFEGIMREFSNQGSAPYSGNNRADPDPTPQVPTFDGKNFFQVRAAQDALSAKLRGGR